MFFLHVHIYVYHVHAYFPQRPEEATGSAESGVLYCFETPDGCWELNVSPLKEQQVLILLIFDRPELYLKQL